MKTKTRQGSSVQQRTMYHAAGGRRIYSRPTSPIASGAALESPIGSGHLKMPNPTVCPFAPNAVVEKRAFGWNNCWWRLPMFVDRDILEWVVGQILALQAHAGTDTFSVWCADHMI